jgi:hypothetical protein
MAASECSEAVCGVMWRVLEEDVMLSLCTEMRGK